MMKNALTILLALFGLAVIVVVIILPLIVFNGPEITAQEIRMWVALGVFFLVVITFAILRVYNAIVAHSRIMMATTNKLDKFIGELRRITGDSSTISKAFNSATNALKVYTDKLITAITKKSSDEEG